MNDEIEPTQNEINLTLGERLAKGLPAWPFPYDPADEGYGVWEETE